MSTLWKQVKEAAALFSHVYSSNPLPKLNRNMTFFAGVGFISFMTWALLLSESTVTILKENANPSLCTSMKSTFSCKTSDGTAYEVNSGNCVGYTADVFDWHDAQYCGEIQESPSFSCKTQMRPDYTGHLPVEQSVTLLLLLSRTPLIPLRLI